MDYSKINIYIILLIFFLQWLVSDALPNNPKLSEVDGKYIFKPPLPVRDRKSLLKLLRQHDMKGLGGIVIDDIQESVPHYEKVMKVSSIRFKRSYENPYIRLH